MNDIAPGAYRSAAGFYLLLTGFFYYVLRAGGQFLGQNIVPESASGFSVANPNFTSMNNVAAGILTVLIIAALYMYSRLRDYVVDVGDEMTRVSWSSLSDTQRATAVVVVLVIVSSIFLFTADFVFLKIVNWIIGFAA